MGKVHVKSSLMLLAAALIWGVAFVAQSVGTEYVGPFTFNAIRSLIGGVVLIPCIFLLNRKNGKNGGASAPQEHKSAGETEKNPRDLILGGVCCGVCLCVASNLQQIGISYTTVGKAGFITAMYIILVPLLGIFLKKKVGVKIWVSVALAVAGLYLLCMTEGFSIGRGDAYVLVCALFFAFHILTIDYFSPKADGVKMSCIQFFVSGLISAVLMFLFETPEFSAILTAWLPILYAGVMSCGVAYTLQIIGQRDMDPTVASLILSLESVISVLAGWVILHQSLSLKELLGCVIMFGAIILAQLPGKAAAENR